jgi:hypothetical protein
VKEEQEKNQGMHVTGKPRLIIVFLVVVFLVILGVALYAPAYIASYSPQNSTGITVTPLSYFHATNATGSLSNQIPSGNYTGIFYVQHVCVYHE